MTIAITETTVNTYIFATNNEVLPYFVLEMAQFQFVYGWYTSWLRTILHIKNAEGMDKDLMY